MSIAEAKAEIDRLIASAEKAHKIICDALDAIEEAQGIAGGVGEGSSNPLVGEVRAALTAGFINASESGWAVRAGINAAQEWTARL